MFRGAAKLLPVVLIPVLLIACQRQHHEYADVPAPQDAPAWTLTIDPNQPVRADN